MMTGKYEECKSNIWITSEVQEPIPDAGLTCSSQWDEWTSNCW